MVENFAKEDTRQNVEHNKLIFERVSEMASKRVAQLALMWVHHQGDDVCPIPGTTPIENLNQNIRALLVKLTPEEMSHLEALAAADSVKRNRYRPNQVTWKNSETPPLSSWNPE